MPPGTCAQPPEPGSSLSLAAEAARPDRPGLALLKVGKVCDGQALQCHPGRRRDFGDRAQLIASLVVAEYNPRREAATGLGTVDLLDPGTGALLRRLTVGSPLGASGRVLLVGRHGCEEGLTHPRCTLESVNLATGRPITAVDLPAGRVPVSDVVFSPDGTPAAWQAPGVAPAWT